jgi:CubicO group peptidase (beta-lactamase class C family)
MKRFKLFAVVILIVLLVGNASIFALEESEDTRFRAAYDNIDRYVRQYMKERNAPGFALAITNRARLLRVSTYGFADIKTRAPVTPDTLFEIGSVTKSFTAIALMQLMEEGKFDPQEPVTRYLPWFRVKSKYRAIRSHDLLTHTAGIPANRDDIPGSLYMPWALRFQSSAYAPGKTFYYSNVGYQTLHFVLEKQAGERYAEIIRKRIFQPLGMTSSRAIIDHDLRKRLAVGYQYVYDDRPSHSSHPLVEAPWLEYAIGDGSIASTPKDMAAYMRMLLNKGKGPNGRILSPKGFETFTAHHVREARGSFYGYGISMDKVGGYNRLLHGGGMVGQTCIFVCDMDNGLGVMSFTNCDAQGYPVVVFALKTLQAVLLKKKLPAMPAPRNLARIANAADYAGTYTNPDGRTLILRAEGETLLLLHKTKSIVLESRGEDAFYVDHPDFSYFLLQFGRQGRKEENNKAKKDKKDKRIVVEVFWGPDWYTGAGYTGPRTFEYPERWEAYTGHYRTQNPWFSNFRILLRKGKLIMVTAEGAESIEGEGALEEIEPGVFRPGKENIPEILRFDTIVDGQALRADYSGVYFYRVPGPTWLKKQ